MRKFYNILGASVIVASLILTVLYWAAGKHDLLLLVGIIMFYVLGSLFLLNARIAELEEEIREAKTILFVDAGIRPLCRRHHDQQHAAKSERGTKQIPLNDAVDFRMARPSVFDDDLR